MTARSFSLDEPVGWKLASLHLQNFGKVVLVGHLMFAFLRDDISFIRIILSYNLIRMGKKEIALGCLYY